MLRYVIRRTLLLIPTFFGVTCIAFSIIHLAPGDPVELFFAGGLAAGTEGMSTERMADTEKAKAELRAHFGLDRPIPVQYAIWVSRVVRLDFGTSFKDERPVWNKIRERLPVTIWISVLSILCMYVVAIPVGIVSSLRPGGPFDATATTTLFVLYSLPSFWIGTLLLIFFCGGDYFQWFPPAGLHSLDYEPTWPLWRRVSDYGWHLAMPVLCSAYNSFAALSRYMRASMLENLRQDYVRTARAKGLDESTVILKHVLRNSLIPIVTMLAGVLPALIGGSVIIESIFSVPGLGQLGYQSILARDYPVVLAIFSIGSFLTLVGILLADLVLAAIDPRISFEGTSA